MWGYIITQKFKATTAENTKHLSEEALAIVVKRRCSNDLYKLALAISDVTRHLQGSVNYPEQAHTWARTLLDTPHLEFVLSEMEAQLLTVPPPFIETNSLSVLTYF